MLESIKNFFAHLLGYFESIFDFIIDFISDLIYIIRLLGSLPVGFAGYISFLDWLPASIVVFICSITAVAIIYKILGREG